MTRHERDEPGTVTSAPPHFSGVAHLRMAYGSRDLTRGVAHLACPRFVEAIGRGGDREARDETAFVVVDARADTRDAFLRFLVVERVTLLADQLNFPREGV